MVGYLWSPKRSASGARNPFYESMREVSPGDLIISFYGHQTPGDWNCPIVLLGKSKAPGWKVKVAFSGLNQKIRPKDHIDVLRPLLPERYSRLQPNGNGLQSVYLTEIPATMAEGEALGVEALEELKNIAFSRVGNAVTWGKKGVQLKESVDLDDATMAAIAEVSESAEGALKIKFHGKPEAIDKIGKILGWYDQEAAKQQTQINIVISRAEGEGRL